jgi:peptidoglycan-associated lipoprotein
MLRFLVPALLSLNLLSVACTDDKKVIQEPITEEKKNDNSFTVDEKTGKLEFNAEIVYFGYDEATLTPEGMARIDAIAAHMKQDAVAKLSIEGHCDDRGSVEYNLALGQRRSDAVKKYLETVGISNDRLAAVSFGEEKPALAGAGEENWAKNRRVEFAFAK